MVAVDPPGDSCVHKNFNLQWAVCEDFAVFWPEGWLQRDRGAEQLNLEQIVEDFAVHQTHRVTFRQVVSKQRLLFNSLRRWERSSRCGVHWHISALFWWALVKLYRGRWLYICNCLSLEHTGCKVQYIEMDFIVGLDIKAQWPDVVPL